MSSSRLPIRFACSVIALAALCAAGAGAAQQGAPPRVDEALVSQLARLLQSTDERRVDVALLRELLQHADAGVRRQAALAAGRSGDRAAAGLLVQALADSGETVAAAAAFGIGLLRDPSAVEALSAAVRSDRRAAVQTEAVTALAKIGGTSGAAAVRDVLVAGAATSTATPAITAALVESWRLGELAPVEAITPYADVPDAGLRYRAVYSLARLRAPGGLQAVVGALQDREVPVRVVAARGIPRSVVEGARLDPRALGQRLTALLSDADPSLRVAVLRSLSTYNDSTLAPAVVGLLTDADPGVVIQAETTLGMLGGRAALDALRPRLASAVFAVRRQAAIGVAQAGGGRDSTDVAAFRALAVDADWRWRSVAAEAYAAAGMRPPLEGLVADADPRVVAQALQGLGRVVPAPDTALLPRARTLLAHADPVVRSVAADLLARTPREADVDRLAAAYRRAAADSIADARLSAVAALGAIAQASAAGRIAVATRFLAVVPAPQDYLVHRLGLAQLPDARDSWGETAPVATGRTEAFYRDAARRWLVPALAGQPNPRLTIETDRGTLEVELFPTEAPLTVATLLTLAEGRYFDGQRWHRVVPDFVIQGGDPRGDGWGGPGFVLRDEVNPLRYLPGMMGMALSGPDTGGSQFFIVRSSQPHLDGTYPVVGRVVSGQGTVAAITMGDRIRSVHR